MRAGQRRYVPGVGSIYIVRVDEIAIDQCTDADAIPDDFTSAEALRQELTPICSDMLADGPKAFRVAFRLGEPDQED